MPELEMLIAEAIASAEVGEKVEVYFPGLARPVEVALQFAGGWEVRYTIIPGAPLYLIKGEGGYIDLRMSILEYSGLKPQV